ncbi:hypothetical protein QT381_09665 [Galbitalea sp. SE-J8]|uniref:hypothetical protein n=1 Tax=Galbitalea sp. SE-J8 TaxID=3054952 RepID=UPI00259CC368|nr:hypothetical protein [Galbitalea sp. SE-J8]MDM4763273.1 hypothetical protein [Galbitalea sp. SE-J8]
MPLSRKRKKELAQLRKDAGVLLKEQREVLGQAGSVVREAGQQAAHLTREEVAPRIRDAYETRVHPAVDRGAAAALNAAHTTRSAIVDDVLPQVGAVIGSALASLDIASKPEVKKAIKKASKKASAARATALKSPAGKRAAELAARAGVVKPTSSGPGKYILIGLGVVVVAGIAYAAWQTLRADDDLWIDDELDQADVETPEA